MDEESPASVAPPPDPLPEPNVVRVGAGDVLHRVHARALAGNAFNPCRGGQTRFAPIRDAKGDCVPSLYAGSTVESAVYETVFHDVPLSASLKTVPREAVEKRRHSTLLARRDLWLASLRAPDLLKWGVRREALIGSLPTQYGRTARWARAIHRQFDDIDGLVWTSNVCDPDDAMLFFGDRVTAADVRVVAVREGTDGSFLADVRNAGLRGGILVSL